MDSVSREPLGGERRRLANDVRDQLRETFHQLSTLNHAVGSQVRLRDTDLDCLDLVQRKGPIMPSDLARSTGVHPATLTGILDRLERAGWITRSRPDQSADRRAVLVTARRERMGEIFGHYAGMLTAMDDICSGYTAEELALLLGFLRRTATAGQESTTALSDGSAPAPSPERGRPPRPSA